MLLLPFLLNYSHRQSCKELSRSGEELTMEKIRYGGSCSNHALSLLLLLFLSFDVSMAAAQPPRLGKAQESIMRNLSSMVLAMATPSTRWNTTSSNPCLWSGVACSVSEHSGSSAAVTELSLSGFGLSDSTILLASICSLDTLQSLDLSRNSFTNLRGQFSPCPLKDRLRVLNFSGNRLAGQLGEFSGFRKLEVLDFSFNYLSGNVKRQLSSLSRLRRLDLSSNEFDGDVPANMARSLEVLVLSGNRFSGQIPTGLFRHGNLAVLDLSRNNLTGDVPDEFFKLSKLSILLLSGNGLSGTILSEIKSLQYLIELDLANNELSGTIPTMPSSLKTLLNLSHNHLSGSIPGALGTLNDLEILDLSHNYLAGQIPTSLSDLQSLTQLVLSYNQLSGDVPVFPPHVAVDVTGNPGIRVNEASDMVVTGTQDYSSATWVAAVSFVGGFVISFYGDGIRNGWFTGSRSN